MRALARRHRTTIVGDEVLTELTIDGPAPGSFAGDGTAAAYVVSIGSASKSFWGGLRVGWVRAHPDLVAPHGHHAGARRHRHGAPRAAGRGRAARATPTSSSPVAARRCGTAATCSSASCCDQLPSWRFEVPAGGLSLWADLGAPVSSALAAISARHGVRVVPGTAFGVDGSFERNLRLPFTTTADDLRRAVAGLADAWAGLGVTEPADRTSAGVHAMV